MPMREALHGGTGQMRIAAFPVGYYGRTAVPRKAPEPPFIAPFSGPAHSAFSIQRFISYTANEAPVHKTVDRVRT